MKDIMQPLPYELDSLTPVISRTTLEFHHGKHLQTYVNNLINLSKGTPFENETVEKIITSAPEGPLWNNAAQVFNHNFYFSSFAPTPARTTPIGKLEDYITKAFGSFDEMKRQMSEASVGLFGSGWVWLSIDDSCNLSIGKYSNAGNPLKEGKTPLLCIDVWEHAYYLDYQNRRADHVAAIWNIINWETVEQRLP